MTSPQPDVRTSKGAGIDSFAWAEEAAKKLREQFGDRLAFVGLQGSRARGEETAASDIDLVVLLDDLDDADLAAYKAIVQTMPQAELACGFVGSSDVLAKWPRHELFQFVNDTVPLHGKLPFAPSDFTREEAKDAARIGASGIYHATCHAAVFDGDAEEDVLRELAKGAFFTLQALHFSRTGEYVRKKSDLAKVLSGEDAEVLAWSLKAKATPKLAPQEVRELSRLLLRWSGNVIAS
ncbi:nucleotidyltransferase domain-containing protein [Xiamenia xianingshaonis]|uniref:Nucleotidyltransferase domain-containing protein n=1 Tax=Xiamenia xianingshaonis TaxID=2682776 RepID=A0ABX0IL35_9ACTN|nr:nucleotidyltransferase domain-containing protein [Xiamenia xianingshaonis]NHM13562.1 nucleotidyltransferase domain-containing protein [Xiamenia xianingshaonis]